MRVIFRANDSNIVFNTFIWKVKSVSLCAKETSCKPKRTVFKDLQIEFITVKSMISIRGIIR